MVNKIKAGLANGV